MGHVYYDLEIFHIPVTLLHNFFSHDLHLIIINFLLLNQTNSPYDNNYLIGF